MICQQNLYDAALVQLPECCRHRPLDHIPDICRHLAEGKGQAVITVTRDVQLSALTQRQVRLAGGKIVAR